MTEIFSAALPPTEASKFRVITSQRYASVPFLGTTIMKLIVQTMVKTKAYIVLIMKLWYVRENFLVTVPGRSPQSLNYDATARNFWLRIAWNLVQTEAYIALITKWCVTEKFSAALHPARTPKVRVMTSQQKWRYNLNFEGFCRG